MTMCASSESLQYLLELQSNRVTFKDLNLSKRALNV